MRAASRPRRFIELRDVVFSYAEHTVVDGVSLQVDRGELVALLGPNGCGKTTIMRLINGLELADAGAYLFDGHAVDAAFLKDSAAAQRFHQRVGFVFQNADAQLFCATVGEEVAFGPAQMGLPADELERRVRDAIGAVPGCRPCRRLSLSALGRAKEACGAGGSCIDEPRYPSAR